MGDLRIVCVSSCKEVEAQYVEMMVPLYSYGCEKKIKNALSNLKGIYSINVDYNEKKVTVWGICNKYDVLSTVKGKRKGARFWSEEDDERVEMKELSKPNLPTMVIDPPHTPRPSLSLMKARSLSKKMWNKVFTRSYSF
ncbi:hypothetical protein ACFE04_009129 [Oxalis oulophora]